MSKINPMGISSQFVKRFDQNFRLDFGANRQWATDPPETRPSYRNARLETTGK